MDYAKGGLKRLAQPLFQHRHAVGQAARPAVRQPYLPNEVTERAFDFSQPFSPPEIETESTPQLPFMDEPESSQASYTLEDEENNLTPLEFIGPANDLDIPAFLRRKVK